MTRILANLEPAAEVIGYAVMAVAAVSGFVCVVLIGACLVQDAAVRWHRRHDVRIEPSLATVLTLPQRRKARRDGGAA